MLIGVTGGAGYIGSHACVHLLEEGYDVLVLDNLINSKEESLRRVQSLTGKELAFEHCDLLEKDALRRVLGDYQPDAILHFAGLKAVGESVERPLDYYHNNVTGTLNLCTAMAENGIKDIVFSSSATVYGEPETVPITEDFPVWATNPYGWTKFMIEQILSDLYQADPAWNAIILRYFNPVGAHPSGQLGENPFGRPNNLFPYITQVAVGRLECLQVFGDDYPTRDGTGVRDYIHVVDLVNGHIRAIEKLDSNPGSAIYNLGTGRGYTVLEAVSAFSKACGKEIPYKIVDRRPGDVAACYADPSLAERDLGWKAEKGLKEMCEDAWRWQSMNPDGF